MARNRVLERDGGYCQVPCCSRAADLAHRITSRSEGGGDDPENLISVCATHQKALRLGYVHVEGKAPHGLTWELGVRAGEAPFMRFEPRSIGQA